MNYLEQQTEQLLEQRTEKFIKDSLFSNEVLDMISENMRPIDTLMSYYKCASMEVETKFKVLNEQFSLAYDCNPIESIKTRLFILPDDTSVFPGHGGTTSIGYEKLHNPFVY